VSLDVAARSGVAVQDGLGVVRAMADSEHARGQRPRKLEVSLSATARHNGTEIVGPSFTVLDRF